MANQSAPQGSQKFTIREVNGLDERTQFTNPDPGSSDILRGCIPSTKGALTKVSGTKLLLTIAGEPIYNICQTFDSRQNIIIQTRDRVYIASEDEFFGRVTYVPNITPTPTNEEETMPYAILAHTEAAGVNGGGSTTGFSQHKLNSIITQVNPDGTAAAFCTIALGQFTLQPGTYRINGWAIGTGAAADSFITQLFNVTAGNLAWVGLDNANGQAQPFAIAGENVMSAFGGVITITPVMGPTTFEIRQSASTAVATTGLGRSVATTGKDIFAWVEIVKSN